MEDRRPSHDLLVANTTVETFGWGAQNDTNHQQPQKVLKGISMNTTSCGNSPPLAEAWPAALGGEPCFFCTSAGPLTGGPCSGDDGGDGSILRYQMFDEAGSAA